MDYWTKIYRFFKSYKTSDMGIQYAIDVVIHKKYTTSKYVFKACQRHLLFLYKTIHDTSFKFIYAYKQVLIAYAFFKLQIIPESKKPYILAPYRAFMLSVIIGLRFKNKPEKIITQEIMDTEARKNGKSTFHAILANFVSAGFLGDGLPQIFIIGAGEKSSKILFKLCQNLIAYNPLMRNEFIKNNRDLIKHRDGGEIVKLPFEKSSIEGQNPTLVILTEFHLHPNNSMQESARTSFNESRNNQLIIYDTTKGQNMNYPYYDLEKTFKQFLDEQINNPEKLVDNWNIFLFCAELDFDLYEDWQNPKNWSMANPNIGITLSLESMIKQYSMLINKLDLQDFKIKKIGMWINQSDAYFDLMHLLDSQEKNKSIYNEYFVETDKFKYLNCVLGLDLSNSKDTTALVETFEIEQPDNESIWVIKHLGFIPKATANEKIRIDKVPYFDWAKEGFLKIQEGDVVDYNSVSDEITNSCDENDVAKLAYDEWQFRFIKNKIIETSNLRDDDLIPIKQGVNLTPAIREFERKLLLKKIYIVGDNPMLIDHILNISMRPSKNINNNFYPEKVQLNSRIDGAIAMFTALQARYDVGSKSNSGSMSVIKLVN